MNFMIRTVDFGTSKFAFVVAVICLGIAGTNSAATADDPVDRLRLAESFAIGGIGIAGTMSDGESALRVLLHQEDATARLENLLLKAAPAGQLYALLGLRVHDRGAYERDLKSLPVPDVTLETIGGCIISRASFKDVLERIKTGQYDAALARPFR
jgi:hypothetical protein